MYQSSFMQQAIDLSAQALTTPGTEPFGAIVVKDGKVIGKGLNHSAAHFDPTSHGEVEAIRDACRNLRSVSLDGCELYTSCEPCPLCVAAMHIAGIARLYYAASLEQSRALLASLPTRRRIDIFELRREVGMGAQERRMPAEQQMDAAAVSVLEAWVVAARRS